MIKMIVKCFYRKKRNFSIKLGTIDETANEYLEEILRHLTEDVYPETFKLSREVAMVEEL